MASISKKGGVAFSKDACAEFNIRSFKHVRLYYDKEANTVGFDFSHNSTSNSMSNKNTGVSGSKIGAEDFFRCFKIDTNKARRYRVHSSKNKTLIYIDLNSPLTKTKND